MVVLVATLTVAIPEEEENEPLVEEVVKLPALVLVPKSCLEEVEKLKLLDVVQNVVAPPAPLVVLLSPLKVLEEYEEDSDVLATGEVSAKNVDRVVRPLAVDVLLVVPVRALGWAIVHVITPVYSKCRRAIGRGRKKDLRLLRSTALAKAKCFRY